MGRKVPKQQCPKCLRMVARLPKSPRLRNHRCVKPPLPRVAHCTNPATCNPDKFMGCICDCGMCVISRRLEHDTLSR